MRLPIFQYGAAILRAKGKRIDQIDDRIRELAANMLETMQAVKGVGLAAQQVGEAIQLTVLDVSPVVCRPPGTSLDVQRRHQQMVGENLLLLLLGKVLHSGRNPV